MQSIGVARINILANRVTFRWNTEPPSESYDNLPRHAETCGEYKITYNMITPHFLTDFRNF